MLYNLMVIMKECKINFEVQIYLLASNKSKP